MPHRCSGFGREPCVLTCSSQRCGRTVVRRRVAIFTVLVVVAGFVSAATALAWSNGPDGGNGFGTNDWILEAATDLARARGVGWVDLRLAQPHTDDPDTVFHDFSYHVYNHFGGDHYGSAPKKVALYYGKALAARRAGRLAESSTWFGIMAHYYAQVCCPLDTDDTAAERRIYRRYQGVVDTLTDAPDKSNSWVADDGAALVSNRARFTIRAAAKAHDDYSKLVSSFNRYGFNSTVRTITIRALNRAVNGLADMIISLEREAPAPAFDLQAAVRNAKAGDTITVPAETYSFSGRLHLPDGVNVQGAGAGSWLNGPVQAGSNATYSNLRLGAKGFASYVGGVSNVTFTNVRFSGGGGTWGTTWPYQDSNLVTIGMNGTTSNILFDTCEFDTPMAAEDPTWTLHFDQVFISLATNVTFNTCHWATRDYFAVEIWDDSGSGSRGIDFAHCTFEGGKSANIDYATSYGGYSTIDDCTFNGNGSANQWPNDITVEAGGSYITVQNSHFKRGVAHAVQLEDTATGCLITGNDIDATVDNGFVHHTYDPYIRVDAGATRNTITNNTINTGGSTQAGTDLGYVYGIIVSGDNNTVTGNTITTPPNHKYLTSLYAVDIRAGGDNNIVTGNTFSYGRLRNAGSGNTTTPNTVN